MSIPLPNVQPVEKQKIRADGVLDVVDVFLTLQGEGPFAGLPAVFVRTAGCNLSSPICSLCDTSYTGPTRRVAPPEGLLAEVQGKAGDVVNLVVITGGEPFRQNLVPFVHLLLKDSFLVQIETNGTLMLDDFPYDLVTVVCSPKTAKLSDGLKPWINDLKYVLSAGQADPLDGLPLTSLGSPARPCRPWSNFAGQIWVQPTDEQNETRNKENLRAAAEVCLKYGYRLTTQLHKGIGLP